MNVLVTGGAGVLGGYAVAALTAAGHNPIAYDVAPPGAEMLAVAPQLSTCCRFGSITDMARLFEVCRSERIDAIVHMAGRVGLEPSLADPPAFLETNVMGLVNVCEVMRQLGLRKLVAISSNAAYHKGTGDKLVETDPPFSVTGTNPAAHYGTSKMAGEAIGMAYAQFQNVDFLALRTTAIYGFGMRSPMYIKPMVENSVLGKPTRFAAGGPMKRDYTHVLDCCDAIVMAVNAPRWKDGEQRILNVAAGRACTATEGADTMAMRSFSPTAAPRPAPGKLSAAPISPTASWSKTNSSRPIPTPRRRSQGGRATQNRRVQKAGGRAKPVLCETSALHQEMQGGRLALTRRPQAALTSGRRTSSQSAALLRHRRRGCRA